jgi:hypothetical protein
LKFQGRSSEPGDWVSLPIPIEDTSKVCLRFVSIQFCTLNELAPLIGVEYERLAKPSERLPPVSDKLPLG